MDKKKLKFQYEKKIKLINKLNKSYYDKSKPEITDKEYDNLKKQILIII